MLETKLDPKEEREYDQLRRLGQRLHIPIPEHFIELEVRDKAGNVIQRHKQRSHSWTRNAYNLLFVQLAGKGCTGTGTFEGGEINGKDTTGTIRGTVGNEFSISGTDNPDDIGRAYLEGAGEVVHGILVGSGVNAESFEDYVLQTPIAEGAGAGELNHIQSEPNAYSYGALVGTNTLIRYFNNNGGIAVDVNEVCLVCKGVSGVSNVPFAQSRDHLAATVTVPDTGQLKVTYTISLTYPS